MSILDYFLDEIIGYIMDNTSIEDKIGFHWNDNINTLRSLPDQCIDMIYMDPPFNANKKFTGKLLDKYKKEIRLFFEWEGIEWKEDYESPFFTDVWGRETINEYDAYESKYKNEEIGKYLQFGQ